MTNFNTNYFIDYTAILSLLERKRQVEKFGRHHDHKRIGVVAPEGCMRGTEDVGFLISLQMKGILDHADVFLGGSVNGVTAFCLPDYKKGLSIFPYVIQNNFLRLARGDIGNALKAASADITRRVLPHKWALTPPINPEILIAALEKYGPEEGAKSRMERYVALTDARSGRKVLKAINDLPREQAIELVIAGAHLIGMAGPARMIDGIPYVDSAFSREHLPDLAVDELKCTELVMTSSTPPHGYKQQDRGQRKLFGYYLREHNPDAHAAFDENYARGTVMVDELRSKGSFTTPHGNHAPATFIQPDDSDPLTHPTETNPREVRRGMEAGFERGMWLMKECHQPFTEDEAAEGMALIKAAFENVIQPARPLALPKPLPETHIALVPA